jgi:hypothetical protein
MKEIAITLASHVRWDWQHGGNKHSTTDLDSWKGAFANCMEQFLKWCVKDCPKPNPPEPPDPWWVPPFPIPDPFPIMVDPCLMDPLFCPKPQA